MTKGEILHIINANDNHSHLGDNMKKIISLILVCVISLTCLCGCSKIENNSDKLTVYTSIYPLYDFATKIGGEMVEVKSIIPTGVEPHDWEPTAKDVINLSKADLFIYNGAHLEHWVEDIEKTLTDSKVNMLCATDGIEKLKNNGEDDPHIWLDPVLVIKELETIKNALISLDTKNSDYYTANFEKYKTELEALDKEYSDALSNCSKKTIITVHKAYAYLCNRYGLTQVTAEGAVAESEPEAKVLLEIIDTAKANGIKTVFVAEEGSSKVADTLAKEIGGEVKVLYNLESLSDEQTENGADYFSVMRENLEVLKEVLK